MTTLTEQLKQALDALAFADLGERIGRREKHAALFPVSASPSSRTPCRLKNDQTPTGGGSGDFPESIPQRWIALGVGDALSAPVMRYVIGACRRMQAGLLLLSVDALRVRTLLTDYLPALQGIECRTEELSGSAPSAVQQALHLHRGVLFAVTGEENNPLRSLLSGRRAARPPVPVVVVSEKTTRGE
ncbi:MAG: hypothetical protein HZB71_07495 [Betaproteobacteria bacterium]|nr:hypothetical protein [Betaproteobacteria bacterium]